MRIKKVNELTTTEIHPLMGGKIDPSEAKSLLETLATFNENCKEFLETEDNFETFMKKGVLTFQGGRSLIVRIDAKFR